MQILNHDYYQWYNYKPGKDQIHSAWWKTYNNHSRETGTLRQHQLSGPHMISLCSVSVALAPMHLEVFQAFTCCACFQGFYYLVSAFLAHSTSFSQNVFQSSMAIHSPACVLSSESEFLLMVGIHFFYPDMTLRSLLGVKHQVSILSVCPKPKLSLCTSK